MTSTPQSVVAPVEPTEAMHYAGDRILANAVTKGGSIYDTTKAMWSAMLAAAAAPSSLVGGEVLNFALGRLEYMASACEEHWTSGPQSQAALGVVVRRDDLRAILAALSPEAPARKGDLPEPPAWLTPDTANGWRHGYKAALTRRHEAPAAHGTEQTAVLKSAKGPIGIDASIAPIVQALWNCGLKTVASCSGHTHRPGNIALADGRELIIARDYDEARKIDALFPKNICGEEAPAEGAGERADLISDLEALLAGEPVFVVNHPIQRAINALRASVTKPEARESASPAEAGSHGQTAGVFASTGRPE